MTFHSSFLCVIAIIILIVVLSYTTLKKRFKIKQNLIVAVFCIYYTYLIPLMTNSDTIRKYWSIIPFYNLYNCYIEQNSLFYSIINLSIVPILLCVILGVVMALLVCDYKKIILSISGILIIESIGFIQMIYGYTIFKAFDSSIIIAQLVLYFSSIYITKYIKKKLGSRNLKCIK